MKKRTLLLTAAAVPLTVLAWMSASLAGTGEVTVEPIGTVESIDTGSRAPAVTGSDAVSPEPSKAVPSETVPSEAAPPVPGPLGPHVEKGLAYLASQQQPDGGWGQGGGWRALATGGRIEPTDQQYRDQADVANTAIATLALLRSGSSPTEGPYAENVRAGLAFVLRSVEQCDPTSLFVSHVRGTQLQTKIGIYVDTFLANLLLAEVRKRMPDAAGEIRVEAGLDTVISMIERHQRSDGTFAENLGWASVLSQSIANKALNRSRQAGFNVADSTLRNLRAQAQAGYDEERGEFIADERSGSTAGVKLYAASAQLAALDDLVKTGSEEEQEARRVLDSEASAEDKRDAALRLETLRRTRQVKGRALETMTSRIADAGFVAGFGSSGGEEYLSYMNISEALAADGGPEWERWNERVSKSLAEAQNADGSWSGHHCITGRTFVTSSALLTLMADRAPHPLAASVQG